MKEREAFQELLEDHLEENEYGEFSQIGGEDKMGCGEGPKRL